ncbi:hypothetical protein [Streptomyces sp. NPDC048606]|uniref:hypothetical protein n=1 Tax=Streptomyces sp. NPDC048606 TaxID=3154726 RepID=UPI00342A8141
MYATLLKLEGDVRNLHDAVRRIREMTSRVDVGENLQHTTASPVVGGFDVVLFFNSPDLDEALRQTRHIVEAIHEELPPSEDRWRLYSSVAEIRPPAVW